MSALAAAIVAAVLLWPQWGPYVTEGVSSAIAYYTPNEAPKAAAKAPVEPVVSAPAVAPEAVTTAVAAAVPPSGAAAVAAGYRRSWDAVISLSLGLKAGGSASGDPSTK